MTQTPLDLLDSVEMILPQRLLSLMKISQEPLDLRILKSLLLNSKTELISRSLDLKDPMEKLAA
jgi:hypothetical protein